MALNQSQKALLTKVKASGAGELGIRLDDETCCYLVALAASDLSLTHHFPEFSGAALPSFFDVQSPSQLRIEKVNFLSVFERLLTSSTDSNSYLHCLAMLHKARLKYERILQAQPLPTLEQVGPRALLQYGNFSTRGLVSWLIWRKWVYDVDNRAAQETGYLFEPIIAQSIGGVPFSAKNSPIKRNGSGAGRQVDCLCEDDGLAYEIKLRVTIAASGQGRWGEELEFPKNARDSRYKPVLVVLDPTDNEKLRELKAAFKAQGGDIYLGGDAWFHLESKAGPAMAIFLDKYVRTPLQDLLNADPDAMFPGDLQLSFVANRLSISVAGEQLIIVRDPKPSLAAEPEQLPLDIEDSIEFS